MNILLTGASGVVGSALLAKLSAYNVRILGRKELLDSKYEFFYGSLSDENDFNCALKGVDIVIHCAAQVHLLDDISENPLSTYRKINTFGTNNLARQAAKAGVKRFIFISTIKVNGEYSLPGKPFCTTDKIMPSDPYSLSKAEAEASLRNISLETGMEVVIIRPPLVYGGNVKGNFLSLMMLADTGIPLPFGSINNRRSMIYVENLVDFIIKCIKHPAAANQVFLVSDDKTLSLSDLFRMIRSSLGRPCRLFPFSSNFIRMTGTVTFKTKIIDRLIRDLQIDYSKAEKLLGWSPPFSVKNGIDATVSDYIKNKKRG